MSFHRAVCRREGWPPKPKARVRILPSALMGWQGALLLHPAAKAAMERQKQRQKQREEAKARALQHQLLPVSPSILKDASRKT